MTAGISVRQLTKSFAGTRIVDEATFDVPRGAVTAFVGANGAGKTTTMQMILGLVTPDDGQALVEGRRFTELGEPRHTVGAVLSDVGGHPGVTARQHLRMVASGAGLPPAVISPALAEVGLSDAADKRLGTYSTGMTQRVALAAALLANPRVLVLDEPASGLDPKALRWLRVLLRAKADAGAAVFVSTHQLAEFAPIVDFVVVIDDGKIVASSGANELLELTDSSDLGTAVLALTS